MLRVLTIGTFDRWHYGHERLIVRASAYGPVTVGVNSDRFVATYKGVAAQSEAVRMQKVGRFQLVGKVLLNDGPGIDLIREVNPDLLVIGSDWLDLRYCHQLGTTRDELADLNVAVLFLPRTPGISSTDLRAA